MDKKVIVKKTKAIRKDLNALWEHLKESDAQTGTAYHLLVECHARLGAIEEECEISLEEINLY